MVNYYLITKPGIIFGNLLTLAAGFLLASHTFSPLLFLTTLSGLALVIASACVFNNCIDKTIDKKMERTKNRPIASEKLQTQHAFIFASILGVLGIAILSAFTNITATLTAGLGFFIYVCIYSFLKTRTIYGTAIGSIAGAIPPVVGYTAVTNQLDFGSLVLFTALLFWQMPHFFSIALFRLNDYKQANVPVFPLKKGSYLTKIRITLYIAGFLLTILLLSPFHYATLLAGAGWFFLSLLGFKIKDEAQWAKDMFIASLITIMTMSATIIGQAIL